MPERFRVVCTIKALYKCSDFTFLPFINDNDDDDDNDGLDPLNTKMLWTGSSILWRSRKQNLTDAMSEEAL